MEVLLFSDEGVIAFFFPKESCHLFAVGLLSFQLSEESFYAIPFLQEGFFFSEMVSHSVFGITLATALAPPISFGSILWNVTGTVRLHATSGILVATDELRTQLCFR